MTSLKGLAHPLRGRILDALFNEYLVHGADQLDPRWYAASTIDTVNLRPTSEQLASRRTPSGHEARELHELWRAAALGRTQIEASRDLGINQLLS